MHDWLKSWVFKKVDFGCIMTVKVPSFWQRTRCIMKMTKHIDMRFHIIRELISFGQLLLEKFHTSKNVVDMLTKHVTTKKFKSYLDLINISKSRWKMP